MFCSHIALRTHFHIYQINPSRYEKLHWCPPYCNKTLIVLAIHGHCNEGVKHYKIIIIYICVVGVIIKEKKRHRIEFDASLTHASSTWFLEFYMLSRFNPCGTGNLKTIALICWFDWVQRKPFVNFLRHPCLVGILFWNARIVLHCYSTCSHWGAKHP